VTDLLSRRQQWDSGTGSARGAKPGKRRMPPMPRARQMRMVVNSRR